MEKIILINKKIGQTPLDAIGEFRSKNQEYKTVKLGYAGRLDPMASGLLMIMVGEECKKRDYYQNLDKSYIFEILFGISTDSFDLLGLITDFSKNNICLIKKDILATLEDFKGKISLKYPPYGAKRINGQTLYKLSREKKLRKEDSPEKDMVIYEFKLIKISNISRIKLQAEIFEKINYVNGNFRQKDILQNWKQYFRSSKIFNYPVGKFIIHCSSGTYVRAIVNRIGEKIGIPTLALSIKRTGIGTYSL